LVLFVFTNVFTSVFIDPSALTVPFSEFEFATIKVSVWPDQDALFFIRVRYTCLYLTPVFEVSI
jgi:hypothetical protein